MEFFETRRHLLHRLSRLGLAVLIANAVGSQPAVAAATSPTAFVQAFADEVRATLRERGQPRAERLRAVDGLVDSTFALDRIARAALGRYWKGATASEREEFAALFKAAVVAGYSRRFDGYSERRVKVGAATRAGEHIMIESQVEGGPTPIRLDWRVADIGGRWQVLDVLVEGVSLTLTHRNEFSAVIQQHGGEISALLQELRSRAAENGRPARG